MSSSSSPSASTPRKRKAPSASSNQKIGSASSRSNFATTRKHAPRSSSSTSSSTPSYTLSIPVDAHRIGNATKRHEVFARIKSAKARDRAMAKRQKQEGALGEDPSARPAPKVSQKTLESLREHDETVVADSVNDTDLKAEEDVDEFRGYYMDRTPPKIIITSCYHPSKMMYDFIRDLLHVFPNSVFYERKKFSMKAICKVASEAGYTDVLVVNEDRKKFNGLTHVHLPDGPTAYYRLSSVLLSSALSGHGLPTAHRPEVILNNFTTRLGFRVSRMLSTLFHQDPEFRGRRVATFHNQRDFIFFRHHRFVFTDNATKARLQELGPRFTLKLKFLQKGTFNTKEGEYEWKHKTELDTSRRRFFL